jgi:hypothetical protein
VIYAINAQGIALERFKYNTINIRFMPKKIFDYIVGVYAVIYLLLLFVAPNIVIARIDKGLDPFNNVLLPLIIFVGLLSIIFTVYMLIDVVRRKFKKDSQKPLWVVLIIFLNIWAAIPYYYIHARKPR